VDYLPRHAEKTVKELSKMFGAVLVTGMRQVGKSTLLKHATAPIQSLTFDNASTFESAASAPELFFDFNPPPIFLDEIQKAPDLFSQMKMIIDNSRGKGLFYLSGSQHFHMMKQVSDSLAGRIGILNLSGLSLREEVHCNFNSPFIPTKDYISARLKDGTQPLSPIEVWDRIQRGSMPELVLQPSYSWDNYYGTYVRTYIQRDVRDLSQVADELTFQHFMSVLAARTGQILNMAEIARAVGISIPTVKRWLSILVTSNVIYLLRPYYTNLTKRALKSPKLYFTDTGLAAYLSKWNTPEALRTGALAGAYFENFVIMEILKSYYNTGVLDPAFHYYRDKDGVEIDLLIERDGHLHPIEIKSSGVARSSDLRAFKKLERLDCKRGVGAVICMLDSPQAISAEEIAVPLHFL